MPLIHVGDEGRTWLEADNVMSEAFTYPRQVTNHPVGRRSLPADHRITEPMTIDLVLRVTESPLAVGTADNPGGVNPLIYNEQNGEKVANGELPLIFGDLTRPRAAAFATAIKLYETGLWEYLSLSMGLQVNLALVNWNFEIRTPVHVDFNITLQEIEFIAAQRVELPALVVLKKAPETCPTVPTGDKAKGVIGTGSGASDGVSPKDKSLLLQAFDSMAGGEANRVSFANKYGFSIDPITTSVVW
jgi:hypothetical protein